LHRKGQPSAQAPSTSSRSISGRAKAIRDWLLWACCGDVPLFFKEPVGPDAPLDHNDPKLYGRLVFNVNILQIFDHNTILFAEKSEGKFSTKFIIDLVALFPTSEPLV